MTNEELQAMSQIGGAAGVILAASFFGIQWVIKTVKGMGGPGGPIKTEKTTIITADTVAMDHLAKTIEASNVILTENNVMRREEINDWRSMREAIEANTEAVEKAASTTHDARQEIRELTREIVRSGK